MRMFPVLSCVALRPRSASARPRGMHSSGRCQGLLKCSAGHIQGGYIFEPMDAGGPEIVLLRKVIRPVS